MVLSFTLTSLTYSHCGDYIMSVFHCVHIQLLYSFIYFWAVWVPYSQIQAIIVSAVTDIVVHISFGNNIFCAEIRCQEMVEWLGHMET